MAAAHHAARVRLATAVAAAGLCFMLAIGTAAYSPQAAAPVVEGHVTISEALPPNPLAALALPPPSVERGDPEVWNEGDTRTRVFTDPDIVKVFCRIHSYMSAVIRVFDHPYHAVPDAAGRFSMPAPAPGTYDLVVWHERSTEEVHRVTVTASGARLTLTHPRTGS